MVELEIRKCNAFCFVLPLKDCFGYMGPFLIPIYILGFFFPTCVKNAIGILIGIALNLSIFFGSIEILTISILPIHDHRIPFHLFVNFLISFIVSCSFQNADCSPPWLSLFPSIFF